MNKFGDILFMLIGIVLLILTISGEIEMGAIGYIAAILCILFGVSTMYKMRIAGKAIKSDLLEKPHIIEFYKNTMNVWASGRLSHLNKAFEKDGNLPYEKFIKTYRPIEGSALQVFFTQFQPRSDEFLVGLGDSDASRNRGWFTLTNQRLIQKDGLSRTYKEIILSEIDSIEMTGKWTKTIKIKLKNGEIKEFSKVDIYPDENYLNQLRQPAS